ncbi:unnamed protein product [Medioppia subpectinata]|uniref:Fatty acid synthase n=1 Tax=Medioppia subpectinata TaxID=1979941 RepID=A0A7R9KXX5_9ACAR|nr:unnamed protein product [Medioppia subpectinata]CAG2110763.1 unnamed protein product [Medioppia subpectinata]
MSKKPEDIVVSGMSGRFPLSVNTDEFAKNLFSGVDMVTEDDSRWPIGLYDMSGRMGKLDCYKDFDSPFFGLNDQIIAESDPQARLLLEVAYEAMMDAGVNPQELRGTKTGVYVGVSIYSMTDGYPEDGQPDLHESMQTLMVQTLANMKTLYSSRISFANDFKGPCLVVDTACSASLSALTLACNDLLLGNTDYAIVCGTHMDFEPFIFQFQQELGICSPDGMSRVLDAAANGFVKAEAVCCVFLQRRQCARRLYGHILTARMNVDGHKKMGMQRRLYGHILTARMNVDGHKKMGMFFPSSEAQEELMRMTYTDAGIDPKKMTFFEAHATGTKVNYMHSCYN